MRQANSKGGSVLQSDINKLIILKQSLHQDTENLRKGSY